jgi:hypothetical protein
MLFYAEEAYLREQQKDRPIDEVSDESDGDLEYTKPEGPTGKSAADRVIDVGAGLRKAALAKAREAAAKRA